MEMNSKRYKLTAVITAVLVIVGGAVMYYLYSLDRVSTDDAAVDGHIFTITPRVSGYVTQVYVDDNQHVKKSDPLLELDPTPYKVALAQAKAALAQSRATLTSLQLGVPLQLAQTAEQIRGAEARLDSLRKTLDQLQQQEHAASQNVRELEAQHHLSTWNCSDKKPSGNPALYHSRRWTMLYPEKNRSWPNCELPEPDWKLSRNSGHPRNPRSNPEKLTLL